jgi:hypothetical protein
MSSSLSFLIAFFLLPSSIFQFSNLVFDSSVPLEAIRRREEEEQCLAQVLVNFFAGGLQGREEMMASPHIPDVCSGVELLRARWSLTQASPTARMKMRSWSASDYECCHKMENEPVWNRM